MATAAVASRARGAVSVSMSSWVHTNTRRCTVSSINFNSFIRRRKSTQHSLSHDIRHSTKVTANGVNFNVELLYPNAQHQILCLAGALGTANTDFSVQLNNNGGIEDPSSSGSPQFGLVAIDPRGLGGSNTTSSGKYISRKYPTDFYHVDALDGAEIMSVLGHEKFSVMGWSDGANAAIHLAANADTKDSVNKLVVWGGNAYVTEEDIEAYEAVRDVTTSWSKRMREDKASVHGGVEALQLLNNKYTDAMRDILYKRGGDICLAELHRITCPTLVLHGSLDVICHEHHAQYISKHIAGASLEVIPEGKHNLHMRHADEFGRLVRKFLLNDDTLNVADEDDEPQPNIDQIAYGFMGSKALFAALRAGVFDTIDLATEGSKPDVYVPFEDIDGACDGVSGERLRTLLSACVGLQLIRRKTDSNGQDLFRLPRASAEQLCKSSRRYWGDYLSMQVDGQFYNRLADIDNTMRTGTQASHGYEAWFESDPDAADNYTKAQHNGSLATAYALHKRFPELGKNYPSMRMLDVGGGSGAFSIATAKKIPGATAIVLDLPSVIDAAKTIISNEGGSVRKRVSTLALSATDPGRWESVVDSESFDVVLMSYVSGSIPSNALPSLYENAFRALRPGGTVVIHDFFVNNDGRGPSNAALWALAHVSVNPEGMGLVPRRIVEILSRQGFVAPRVHDLIPGMTQVIIARKKG